MSNHNNPTGLDFSKARTAPPEKPKCFLTHLLNLNIRRRIYKFLLTNDILGRAESVIEELYDHQKATKYQTYDHALCKQETPRYNLHPAILQTCKLVYEEAVEVLYKENTFFAACFTNCESGYGSTPPCAIVSPLTRNWKFSYHPAMSSTYLSKEISSSFEKARKWNLFLNPEDIQHNSDAGIRSLCQTICPGNLEEISFIIDTPKPCRELLPIEQLRIQNGYPEAVFYALNYFQQYLRNLGAVTFRMGTPEDVVDNAYMKKLIENQRWIDRYGLTNKYIGATLDDAGLTQTVREGLTDCITAATPIEHLFLMFKSLLWFCRSFEFYEPFKAQIGLTADGLLDNLNNDMDFPEAMPLSVTEHPYQAYLKPCFRDIVPFLRAARRCVDEFGSTREFRWNRREIIEAHREHFNGIQAGKVQAENYCAPFFSQKERQEQATEGDMKIIYDLLHVWCTSFCRYGFFMDDAKIRDSTILQEGRELRQILHNLPHERALKMAANHYNAKDKGGFFDEVNKIYVALEKGYTDIEAATNALYSHDIFYYEEDEGYQIS
ncbi:hypothetical protein HYFRA_00008929 [Hymenoscyphus fraxineus]|uniref:DUF7730 domain-containing protein n=1 Tax=Hymenoscyphus fraxineus TaxID=746836 RepID=A0A9N9PSP0_9HELO|nr:hypothetical protein HYFRA_00008929 [Hymenoscyphus fraxineus]